MNLYYVLLILICKNGCPMSTHAMLTIAATGQCTLFFNNAIQTRSESRIENYDYARIKYRKPMNGYWATSNFN